MSIHQLVAVSRQLAEVQEDKPTGATNEKEG